MTTGTERYPWYRESGIIIKFAKDYSWTKDTYKERMYLYKSGYLNTAEWVQFIGIETYYTPQEYKTLMEELYDDCGK